MVIKVSQVLLFTLKPHVVVSIQKFFFINAQVFCSNSVIFLNVKFSGTQAPTHILAPNVDDASARITWDPPGDLSEKEEIIGYKVTLYDAFTVLDVKTTESLQLEFTNLTQFSKYYVTVQVISGAGYGLSSHQLTILTKGMFCLHLKLHGQHVFRYYTMECE